MLKEFVVTDSVSGTGNKGNNYSWNVVTRHLPGSRDRGIGEEGGGGDITLTRHLLHQTASRQAPLSACEPRVNNPVKVIMM